MQTFEQFAQTTSTADLLTTLAALQLSPQNHGKNLRFEKLYEAAIANFNTNDHLVALDVLSDILNAEYSELSEEDPVYNLFTENIMFLRGNYVVFPGISEAGTDVLNRLLRAIFLHREANYPQQVVRRIQDCVFFLLGLSNHLAKGQGLKRNYFEPIHFKAIHITDPETLHANKILLSFDQQWFDERCKEWKINPDTITELLISTPNEHVTLPPGRCIVRISGRYILYQPTRIVAFLIKTIWDEMRVGNCEARLLKAYKDVSVMDILKLTERMQWRQIDLGLSSSPVEFKELFFEFDSKIAYVCLVGNMNRRDQKIDYSEVDNPSPQDVAQTELLQNRRIEIIDHIKATVGEGMKCFTLYAICEFGFAQLFGFPFPSKDDYVTGFRLSELQRIVQYEESDPLLLWKFTEAYAARICTSRISHIGGMLDAYVAYLDNDYSLHPADEDRESPYCIMPHYSGGYSRRSIRHVDEHLASILHDSKVVFATVSLDFRYAPLYRIVATERPQAVLLEDFVLPVWISSPSTTTVDVHLIAMHLDMLGFWLHRFGQLVAEYFKGFDANMPLDIKMLFDSRFKEVLRPGDLPPHLPIDEVDVLIRIEQAQIEVTVPIEMINWYAQPTNEAERQILFELLSALSEHFSLNIPDEDHWKKIDQVIPLGRAKMCSSLGNANNLQLESRFLPYYRPIQKHNMSAVNVELGVSFGIDIKKLDLTTPTGKASACFSVATALHQQLEGKIKSFDSNELLVLLMGINESAVQQNAVMALDWPMRAACLGDGHIEVLKAMLKEQDRTKTALAIRGLIELIVAYNDTSGKLHPTYDDVDNLVTLITEMNTWATISDGIKLKIYDPTIRPLACGRIQIDFDAVNAGLAPFIRSKTRGHLFKLEESYENLFNTAKLEQEVELGEDGRRIEEAFTADWGISLMRVNDLFMALAELARSNGTFLVGMDERRMISDLKASKYKFTEEEINGALEQLTLKQDWSIGKPPQGFHKSDSYTWHYNRNLSYIRRPFAKLTYEGDIFYYWTYRHLYATLDNILALVYGGRYKAEEGTKIHELIKKINNKKGDVFEADVRKWFKINTTLQIVDRKVEIGKNKLLENEHDLGDFDIFAIDYPNERIFPIECKASVESRSIHEIKNEADKYLGRDGGDHWLRKHQKRDTWLKENRAQLRAIDESIVNFEIHSLFITTEEVALPHIMAKDVRLPMISFDNLRLHGIDMLYSK